MKALAFFILAFTAMPGFSQLQILNAGQEKVGFVSIDRYDRSRPAVQEQFKKDSGRFLQINIWYPAKKVTLKRYSFSDYVYLAGRELGESIKDESWKQKGAAKYFEWPASLGADKNLFENFLDKKIPMLASGNTEFREKDLPLVILVHGFAADYAYLAEYLASFGFIVLHVPVKGTNNFELDYETKGLETQVLDYEFALSVLQKEFSLRPSKIAIVGFSFGGQSALAFSIRNQNIKAVVSLDGGIGSEFGGELLSRQSFYQISAIDMPILHLYNPNDQYTDLRWLNQYRFSDRIYVGMKNMQHGYFTSFGLLNGIIPGIMGKNIADPGKAYEAIMLMTKEFIAECLQKKKPGNSKFLALGSKYAWLKDCIVQTDIMPAAAS